jgi:glycosyltransferase involved in cell wall biosynthesis
MRPISVLHVADARSWRGGEQQVLYLHRGLLDRGVDSTVVCAGGGAFHRRLREEQLPHRTLPLHGSWDPISAWRLGGLARASGALVHTHTSHAHGLALAASYLRGRFPLVVSRRVDFAVGRTPIGRFKYHSDRVDLFLAISSGVRDVLATGGVDPERIRLVPSGIDLGRFHGVQARPGWRDELGVAPGRLLVGQVAALAPHKDQATLLRAFARLRGMGVEAELVILGEGALRRELGRMRDELGLGDVVHLPGFTEEVLPRMACFDLFVLSSHLEGLGTAILDAMALGLPVVATRTGGIPDAVEDGVTGRLVPPRDPEALARALAELAGDADRRAMLGRAGRDRVVARFDVEKTVEGSLAAYREVLGRGLAPGAAPRPY